MTTLVPLPAGTRRLSHWRRWSLWMLLGVLVLVMLVTLVYLAARYEASVAQGNVERDADPFHEMGHDDFGLGWLVVDRGAVHGIAARRVATVRPIQCARGRIDIEVNWLRQAVIDQFNILAIHWRLP